MSLEHGDLEILLGGMTESDYENTVSIGQLRVQTGEILAAELKNYAANYYATGNSEIDLEGALDQRKERAGRDGGILCLAGSASVRK